MTKSCYHKKPCADCNGKHATLLHPPTPAVEKKEDAEQEVKNEASCRLVNSKCKLSDFTGAGGKVTVLPVVPVKVPMKNSTSCFELLDSSSNATFCTESLVRRLAAESVSVELKLTTLGRQEEIGCALVRNLEVSDLNENKFIPVPEGFTRSEIPVSSEEFPW